MRFVFLLSFFATLSIAFSPTHAYAQEDDARARRYFEAGNTRYQDGDYEGAVADFEHAYELSHRAGLLFNLYLVNERLGRLEAAADYLERYIDSDPTLEGRDQMLVRLQNVRERIRAAQTASSAPSTSPSDSSTTSHGWPAATWVSFGVSAAGLVTFGVFGALALGENSALADRCGSNAGSTCTDADVATLRRDDLIADIGLGIGIAAAATGVLILLLDSDEDESDPPPAVAVMPWLTHQSGGATLRLSL